MRAAPGSPPLALELVAAPVDGAAPRPLHGGAPTRFSANNAASASASAAPRAKRGGACVVVAPPVPTPAEAPAEVCVDVSSRSSRSLEALEAVTTPQEPHLLTHSPRPAPPVDLPSPGAARGGRRAPRAAVSSTAFVPPPPTRRPLPPPPRRPWPSSWPLPLRAAAAAPLWCLSLIAVAWAAVVGLFIQLPLVLLVSSLAPRADAASLPVTTSPPTAPSERRSIPKATALLLSALSFVRSVSGLPFACCFVLLVPLLLGTPCWGFDLGLPPFALAPGSGDAPPHPPPPPPRPKTASDVAALARSARKGAASAGAEYSGSKSWSRRLALARRDFSAAGLVTRFVAPPSFFPSVAHRRLAMLQCARACLAPHARRWGGTGCGATPPLWRLPLDALRFVWYATNVVLAMHALHNGAIEVRESPTGSLVGFSCVAAYGKYCLASAYACRTEHARSGVWVVLVAAATDLALQNPNVAIFDVGPTLGRAKAAMGLAPLRPGRSIRAALNLGGV